jgi:hypothetical protein
MGIVRIDSATTHGWQLRVHRHGTTRSRFFSDAKHGGADAARAAAAAHEPAFVAEVDAAAPGPLRRLHTRSASPDAAAGIIRTAKRDRRGIPHEVYSVTWRPAPGVAKCTSFSIPRYGEHEAFRRACALRWEQMKAIHGSRYAVEHPDDLLRHKDAIDARADARALRQ